MPNLTSVGITSGVPTSGTGTVSTIDALMADGGQATLGAKTDAKSTATDTTSVSAMSVWKQISASVQLMVFGAGTAAAAQRTTLASDDPAVAALGGTSDAAVTAGATGSISAKLRSISRDLVANIVLAAGRNVIGATKTRLIAATASAMTRPANTTAYSANDAVSNNGTAASVTAVSFTMSDTNDDPILLDSMLVMSTDTGVQGKNFRAYLFNADPTASSGVGGGDNAAWSQKQNGFIGTMVGSFKTFSDGSGAVLTPEDGQRIITKPVSGAQTLFALFQTIDAFTPSANSTTFTATLRGIQGIA